MNSAYRPFLPTERRAFVLARFLPGDALAYVETLAFDAAQRGGVPVDALHCSLLYARGLGDARSFRDELARYTATLGAFDLHTDKLLSANVGSLWLTLEKSDTLQSLCADLARIAQQCGLEKDGFTLDEWIPHILLARFPDSLGLPLGTCVNLTLRVNQFDLTRQISANEFETLARFSLDGKG
ncbi:MAG: 2'-5' RNA ligase family protein [Anaerolineales bacterium]|nr:2'-5' RNA ligase family protein [Anaerolineales bacterium]